MITSSPSNATIKAKLRAVFGFDAFRPLQEEIVQTILQRQDVFVFRGRVDFWQSGQLSLVVDFIQFDDVGRLRAQLEAVKRRLDLEETSLDD